jgi:stage II sporulation protein D
MSAPAAALVLLLGVSLLGGAEPAVASEPMRVALADGLATVEVGVADFVTVLEAGARRPLFGLPGGRIVRVSPAGAGLEVASTTSTASAGERRRLAMLGVRLETRRGPLRIGPRDFIGAIEVWRNGDGLLVINELPLEHYIAGTVRAEASEKWPLEALRAVAVVARTYAVFHQQRNAAKLYHLVASSLHQNFAGHVAEGTPAWEAARGTAGQVLTWQGNVFPAFYHSDSGGFTEPAHLVFSGDGIPPLPGVRDEFSLDSPNYTWAATLPLAVVAERLRHGGVEVGTITGLTVLERSGSLRVVRIAVEHSRGSTTILKGTDFRRLVGYDVLKSTLFVPVLVREGSVRFEGRGWGHGVGLSQFGAKGMAERGYAYAQILEYYYPGAVLVTLR